MTKKKRKEIKPRFILWTKESQSRFEKSVAAVTDQMQGIEEAQRKMLSILNHLSGLASNLSCLEANLNLALTKLEKRSQSARKANATRRQVAEGRITAGQALDQVLDLSTAPPAPGPADWPIAPGVELPAPPEAGGEVTEFDGPGRAHEGG